MGIVDPVGSFLSPYDPGKNSDVAQRQSLEYAKGGKDHYGAGSHGFHLWTVEVTTPEPENVKTASSEDSVGTGSPTIGVPSLPGSSGTAYAGLNSHFAAATSIALSKCESNFVGMENPSMLEVTEETRPSFPMLTWTVLVTVPRWAARASFG